MVKLVIFDLDGVLIDTRDLHFEVLNQALREESEQYVISIKDHLAKFDGLSTNKKLQLLTEERHLPVSAHGSIWKRKQELTLIKIKDHIKYDAKVNDIIDHLKQDGIKVYVASNSIKDTVRIAVEQMGIVDKIDGYYSNEDVKNPKPHPEIYMTCMIKESVTPNETLIIEDSYVGRTAAISSGARLCPVRNPEDVSLEKIYKHINREIKDIKWHDDKLNILIPMAGAGSRFSSVGYTFPKPLIEVNGKPMIQLVIDNLNVDANFIYLVRKEHYDKYNLRSFLNAITPNCTIITVDSLTEGACCTTLLAEEYINNDHPLIIANSDQFIEWKSGEFYHSLNTNGVDGSILTFENRHPKWSYVNYDEYGNVLEVREKEVISDKATVGIYYWAKGADYVHYSHQMIAKNIRVNNEFYVAPVYNEAIQDGKIIKTHQIDKMWGLGTPEDLNTYLNHFTG
jgi:HAD superfamily hydrolase (TIGR01509 family)